MRIQRIRLDIMREVVGQQEGQGDISQRDIERYEVALQREFFRLRQRGDEEINLEDFRPNERVDGEQMIEEVIQKWETKVHKDQEGLPDSCAICIENFKENDEIITLK